MNVFEILLIVAAVAYVCAVAVDMATGGILTDALYDRIFTPTKKDKGKP